MKNYSSNRAQKGKTAYRTPSLFKANTAISSSIKKSLINKDKFRGTENPWYQIIK